MRLDQSGRQLVEAVLSASAQHRAKCQQTSFRGDRLACGAVADAAEAWVAGGGTRLLERSERDDDDDAHGRLVDTGQRILATVGGAWTEISRGAMVGDLVDAIKKDAGTALKVGGLAAAVIAVAGIAGYLAVTSAPARMASTARR